MKKILKVLCCVFAAAFIILYIFLHTFFNYNGYNSEYTDMYTVAVSNVFGINGYESNGEAVYDPQIHIVETDDYGRTLFFYNEYYNAYENPQMDYGMAFVIMQKSDKGYAYYYQDKCYVPYFDTISDWNSISDKIDSAVLESLKKENDWNKPISEEKLTKVKISKKKSEGKIKPKDYEFDKIIYTFETANGYSGTDDNFCKYSVYCGTDKNGKELHYVYGMTMNTSETGENVFDYYEYAIILNADGTCSENGIARINNVQNSFETVRKLKQDNNWKK